MNTSTVNQSFGISPFLLALILVAAPEAGAQSYRYSRVGPQGTRRSIPTDINNAGTIIGFIRPAAPNPSFSFVKAKDGNFVRFTIPGVRSAGLNSINSQGTVIGTLTESNGMSHGFIANSDGSGARTLPLIDGLVPSPSAISANGQVFGNISAFDPVTFETLVQRGVIIDTRHGDAVTYVDYPDPALPFTSLVAGNNRGLLLGSARNADFTEFAYFTATRGNFATVGFPETTFTDVSDINNQGDVVAFYVTREDGKFHPFIRSPNGRVVELDYPALSAQVVQEYPATMVAGGTIFYRADGATLMLPIGINDRGDVVGLCGVGYSDLQNPFPLDPVAPQMFWSFGNSRGFLAEKARN